MRNNLNRLWMGAVCLLALVGQQALRADDGTQDTAKPTELAHPLKVKDSFQYKSTLTLNAGGTDVIVEQNRKFTVKEIKDNGDVVFILANLGGKFTFNGSDMDIPAGSSTTVTQSKNGKILTYVPETEDNPYLDTPTQHLLAMIDQIVFPDKPVKPGDSWTTEANNPAVKDKKVTIKTTFVGPDKVDGVAVWKVKQKVEADTPEAGGKMTSETTAMLDITTGQLVEAEHDVKGVPGKMGTVDWKNKIKRIKPEAKADKKDAA